MDSIDNPAEDEFADLLGEAEKRLESNGIPNSWGDPIEIAEGEHFAGRFRETTVDEKYDPPPAVYLFVDGDGAPRFIRSRTVLDREMTEAKPVYGDKVVIVRGEDGQGKNGNPFHLYAVRSRSCDAPMPAPPGVAEDDIPF